MITIISKDYRNGVRQNLGEEPISVSQNHGHTVEISHEHEYHPQEESNHKHSIDGSTVLDYT